MATAASSKKRLAKPRKKTVPAILNVSFVLDMSWSMDSIRVEAVEGVNDYIRQLKDDKKAKSIRFSLTAFDTVFESWKVSEPIAEVAYVGNEYQPRGNTALYDAIAHAVTELSAQVEKGEKALVVVLTDGEENSSVEFYGEEGRVRLAALIERLEKTGDWTFVYLGANDYDVKTTASSLGIPSDNSLSYTSSRKGTKSAMRAVALASSAYLNTNAATTDSFFADAGLATDIREEDDPTKASSS